MDIFGNHLKRAVAGLQEITLTSGHLLKENQQLHKSPNEINSDLDLYINCLQCQDVRSMNAEERIGDACGSAKKINASAKDCENCAKERPVYIVEADKRASEACNDADTIKETANLQIKECEKTMNERYAYDVALLIRALEESAKELRNQVEERRKRNEELLRKLKESQSSTFQNTLYTFLIIVCLL